MSEEHTPPSIVHMRSYSKQITRLLKDPELTSLPWITALGTLMDRMDALWFKDRRNSHAQHEAVIDKLVKAVEKYQQAIALLYELNADTEIAIGSGLALKQAEETGNAALALAKEKK